VGPPDAGSSLLKKPTCESKLTRTECEGVYFQDSNGNDYDESFGLRASEWRACTWRDVSVVPHPGGVLLSGPLWPSSLLPGTTPVGEEVPSEAAESSEESDGSEDEETERQRRCRTREESGVTESYLSRLQH